VVFDAESHTPLETLLLKARARPVRFQAVESVLTTAEQKRALHASTGAECVEMESRFICAICERRGVAATTVRAILDTATEDLALDFNRMMTPDQRIDGAKLALALLKSPSKVLPLLRLQRQSAAAARRLGQTLGEVLGL